MAKKPHILLVDDDLQVVQYMKAVLEMNGYGVTATTSSREAIAGIQKVRPDLLILDLKMPEPDGFDLLKAERAIYPNLKILVISGYLRGSLLEAAKLLGAVGTLEKPFSAEALAAKVREVIA